MNSRMNHPKVSLILTTYNCRENLKKTLASIEEQDYTNIEVIIKDGGSTDGTLEIISDYRAAGKYEVKTRSEKDCGIYDAMNQGYQMSTGDIIAVCNEKFASRDAVSRFVSAIESGGKRCVGAHSDLVYKDGEKVVRYWKMGEGRISQGWMPGHPTLYLKREVFEKYGLYDTSYRISADYEFMIRFLKDRNNELAYIPDVLIEMFYGGTSTGSFKDYVLSLKEAHRALKSNGVKHAFFIDIIRAIRVAVQFLKNGEKYAAD